MPDVRHVPYVLGAERSVPIPHVSSLLEGPATRRTTRRRSVTSRHLRVACTTRPRRSSPGFRNRPSPFHLRAPISGVPPSRFNRSALPETPFPSRRSAPASGSGPSIPRRTHAFAPPSTPSPPGLHGGSPAPPAGPPRGLHPRRFNEPRLLRQCLTPACSGLATLAADARR